MEDLEVLGEVALSFLSLSLLRSPLPLKDQLGSLWVVVGRV